MTREVLPLPTRVLVVDDEAAALMVIPETLRDGLEDLGWTNLTIETAASGEEALEVAELGEIHLLVADVVMPGIDGIETYAQLKGRFPNLACVVMTAQAPEHSTPIRALRLGAADYVRKPVNPDYLVDTCHRQLVVHHLRRAVDEGRLLMEAIVDSVDAGVIALRDKEVLLSNVAARRMLGAEDSTDAGLLERLAELGLDAARPWGGETGSRELPEVHLPGPDGRTHSVSVIGSPVIDRTGNRLGDVIVARDITHVVERKAMDSFKRMAAIAAHEMKNSVTGLGLVTEHLVARLRDGRLEPHETQRMAEIILDAVARLDRFARSFLNFSRIPDPKPLPTDPNALVGEAVQLYSTEHGLPSWAELKTELTEGLSPVGADRDLMFQVLQNLILNAVESMEETDEGSVVVTTAQEPGYDDVIRITVTDRGVGIPEHMLDRIFEPNVTTRQAGSGLGLVIVRDIVHKHGGRVRVRSVPGEGASFDLLLPAYVAEPSEREEAHPTPASRP